jgi:hypothetical protein
MRPSYNIEVLDLVDLKDSVGERKARGAFFTPEGICDFITAWAVRSAGDRILEPSCGEAAFLVSAGRRLRELGAAGDTRAQLHGFDQLHGVELHQLSVINAARATAAHDVAATVHWGDFFDAEMPSAFEAVVGNPPYVRYQDFTGEARTKGQRAALALGVPLSGLASSWAPFVLHATRFLQAHGRLGVVLPAELLSVNYAAPVRAFLMRRFANVRLVLFEERVFPGVAEEVVLLLAEGEGPTDRFTVHQARDIEDLRDLAGLTSSWIPKVSDEKWIAALLPTEAAALYAATTADGRFEQLRDWGSTSLGMVTGNNRYFALDANTARAAGLAETDIMRISPPGSRHLRGLTFGERAWQDMAASGSRAWLFYPQGDELSPAAAKYIAVGEAAKVNAAYKCRVRKPWWRVPTVESPHLFLTYMNHDTPRLVSNTAGVPHVNSVHGVRLEPGRQRVGQDLLPIAALNSLTALGAEVVGRSYGGGMLKLEPKEAGLLPVPGFGVLSSVADQLRALRPQLSTALRGGELLAAFDLVDRALLVEGLGLRRRDVRRLREAREAMFARRTSRS